MSDEIKQIAALIGHHRVRLEKGNYPTIRASPNSQSRFLISVCSSRGPLGKRKFSYVKRFELNE